MAAVRTAKWTSEASFVVEEKKEIKVDLTLTVIV